MITRPAIFRSTLLGVLGACAFSVASRAIDVEQYLAINGPAPDAVIAYGQQDSQKAEFFRPRGKGPFPVVILIHGGCWLSRYGGLAQSRALAASLNLRGVAVWDVEYRRIDEAGGGFPGTYDDIATAIDSLRSHQSAFNLDLSHVVAVGHSAGAQLALWAASRARIPGSSPLYRADPLHIPGVISIGSLPDLARDAAQIEHACGISVDRLTGKPSADRHDVFADTSPAAMLPTGAQTIGVNGEQDRIAPPALAADYAGAARHAGDAASVIVIPDAGHFDEVDPRSIAWRTIENRIVALAAMR